MINVDIKCKLIGLHGLKESGKSTFASLLISLCNKRVHVLNFAKPMKEMLVNYFYLTEDQCCGEEKNTEIIWQKQKGLPYTAREFMQFFATDICRDQIDKQIWIKLLLLNNKKLLSDTDNLIVIDDVRFENEVEFLKSKGACLIKLDRSDYFHENDNHESEKGLSDDLFDHVFYSGGTLLEYQKRIIKFYKDELKTKLGV